jgi:hypothetical protein
VFFFLVSGYGHMRFDSVGGPVTHPEPHCFASSLYLTLFLAPCTNWKRRNHSSELKQEGQVGTILFPELLRDSESIYKMLSLGYPLTWPVLRCFGISLQILQVEERDERPKPEGPLHQVEYKIFIYFNCNEVARTTAHARLHGEIWKASIQ